MFEQFYNLEKRAQKELIQTKDGSYTLYSREFDECYHSTNDGAFNESLYKHVIPAFSFFKDKEKLTILDICFGLGFNTLATLFYIRQNNLSKKLHIISPELDKELVQGLSNFSYPKEFTPFKNIIHSLSENFFYEDESLKIEILLGDAREEIKKIDTTFDIIYQDAFSPKKNPTLWTKEWFSQIRKRVHQNSILTTYSVATSIRLSLYENGFSIYEIENEKTRKATIASLNDALPLKKVDIKLKKQRNPKAKALSDKDLIEKDNYAT